MCAHSLHSLLQSLSLGRLCLYLHTFPICMRMSYHVMLNVLRHIKQLQTQEAPAFGQQKLQLSYPCSSLFIVDLAKREPFKPGLALNVWECWKWMVLSKNGGAQCALRSSICLILRGRVRWHRSMLAAWWSRSTACMPPASSCCTSRRRSHPQLSPFWPGAWFAA